MADDTKEPKLIVDYFVELRLANVEHHVDAIHQLVQDGVQGPQGEQGAQGDIGPMPKHQWRGSELRFELPDGWGPFVDLRGPSGFGGGGSPGAMGPQGPQGKAGSGTGGNNAMSLAYAWFMGG